MKTTGTRSLILIPVSYTHLDMDTGRAAGMRTVGVLWGFRDREELLEHGACALAACPEELLPLAGVEGRK